jgi:hypothetical protein
MVLTIVNFFSDAIAAFMDGLVSQPETQPATVQDAQAYNQAQYASQAPAAPLYNTAG